MKCEDCPNAEWDCAGGQWFICGCMRRIMKCETCPNAIWDCYEFYGTTRVQKVVIGCKLDKTPEECEEEDEQCTERLPEEAEN